MAGTEILVLKVLVCHSHSYAGTTMWSGNEANQTHFGSILPKVYFIKRSISIKQRFSVQRICISHNSKIIAEREARQLIMLHGVCVCIYVSNATGMQLLQTYFLWARHCYMHRNREVVIAGKNRVRVRHFL